MSLNKLIKARANPNLVVTPAHEEWLLRNQGEVLLSEATAAFVAKQLTSPQRDRRLAFSASSQGSCLRSQMFGYYGMSGLTPSSDTAGIFVNGTWTHLKWQAHGLEAGWLTQAEVPVSSEYWKLRGTMDGLLSDGSGFELKSINRRGFQQVCDSGPLAKHHFQVSAYMLMADIDVFSIVYEEKDTQEWREFRVHREPGTELMIKEDLTRLIAHSEARTLPPMRPDCEQGDGYVYRVCPYRTICPSARVPASAPVSASSSS